MGRVRGNLVPYLKNESTLRFFNSLTVVLLPLVPTQAHLEVAHKYEQTDEITPPNLMAGYEQIAVGQVSLAERPGDDAHGFIAWHQRYTFPVVLDGQHRLAALKEAIQDDNFPDRMDLRATRLSILFLVADERAGFSSPDQSSVLASCRKIFIDLNKYAKQVSKSRQYLLDDLDLTSVSLRSVLETHVEAEPAEGIVSRARRQLRLPLAIVDWRGESAKFDANTGYITTVLALQAVVEALIGISVPAAEDYEGQKRYISRLCSRLLDREEAESLRAALMERVDQASNDEIPFSLTSNDVEQLAQGFRERFGDVFALLVELGPYRRLIEALEGEGYLSSPIEPWFSLEEVGRAQLVQRLEIENPSGRIQAIAKEHKSKHLAFQVVFQRATLLAFNSLESVRDAVLGRWGVESEDGGAFKSEFVNRWDSRIEPLLAQGADAESPLVGAGIRAEGTIDFRKTRVASIAGFLSLLLLAPSQLYGDGVGIEEVHEWVGEVWSHIAPGAASDPIANLYSYHGSRWKRALGDVALARGEDESEDAVKAIANELAAKAIVGE